MLRKVRPHNLRRTFAMLLIAQNAHAEMFTERLGTLYGHALPFANKVASGHSIML